MIRSRDTIIPEMQERHTLSPPDTSVRNVQVDSTIPEVLPTTVGGLATVTLIGANFGTHNPPSGWAADMGRGGCTVSRLWVSDSTIVCNAPMGGVGAGLAVSVRVGGVYQP